MKKKFELNVANKHKDRVVESIKHEIRKYIKREKRKPLGDDFNFWHFDCKIGRDDMEPRVVEFVDIIKSIDQEVSNGANTLYIEILAKKSNKEKNVNKVEKEKSDEKNSN
jgi:hypothetical protein